MALRSLIVAPNIFSIVSWLSSVEIQYLFYIRICFAVWHNCIYIHFYNCFLYVNFTPFSGGSLFLNQLISLKAPIFN